MIVNLKNIIGINFSGTFVADENGSNDPLRRYTDKTLVIVLPGDLTVFDIGNINLISSGLFNVQLILSRMFTIIFVFLLLLDWVSVWCVAFFVDFGNIKIPQNLNVPPSLRMLGIEPQVEII